MYPMHTIVVALGLLCCPILAASQPTPVATQQVFSGNRAQVLEQLRRIAPSCPARVSVSVIGGVSEAFRKQACAVLNQQAGAWCCRYHIKGDTLDIDLSYTDYCLMLGVHEGRLPASRLSSAQRKAYNKACRTVAELRAAHRDEESLAIALHDWVVINTEYDTDMDDDGHVSSLMLEGEGPCECYAGTYYLLARMAGLNCRLVEGKADGTGHAWNLLRLGKQWVHVDCTYDDPSPDLGTVKKRNYFGMNDAAIAHTHQWNRAAYPACPKSDFWYPRRHGERFATMDDMIAAAIARADKTEQAALLKGYVEEVARHPERARNEVNAAIMKHHRTMIMAQDKNPALNGFVSLLCDCPGQGRPMR